jgi:hypothetical protein
MVVDRHRPTKPFVSAMLVAEPFESTGAADPIDRRI